MTRSIAAVIAALVIVGADRASAQDVTAGRGTVEITAIRSFDKDDRDPPVSCAERRAVIGAGRRAICGCVDESSCRRASRSVMCTRRRKHANRQ